MDQIDKPGDREARQRLRDDMESANTMLGELIEHNEGERRRQYDKVWELLTETIQTLDDLIAGTVTPPQYLVRSANYSIGEAREEGRERLTGGQGPEPGPHQLLSLPSRLG